MRRSGRGFTGSFAEIGNCQLSQVEALEQVQVGGRNGCIRFLFIVIFLVPVGIVFAVRVGSGRAILLVNDGLALVLDRITSHSARQALLQPTVLTPVAMVFRYFAVH